MTLKKVDKTTFDKLYETLLEKEILDRCCSWDDMKSSVNWKTTGGERIVLALVEKGAIKRYADEEFLKLI